MTQNIVTLQMVADITTGFTDESEAQGCYQYRVIQPTCFPDFEPSQFFPLLKRSQPPPQDQMLRKGDILIKRLNPGSVIYFESIGADTIASQNLFVIRAKNDMVLSSYLGYLLEQPAILAQFSQLSGSVSAIRALSVKALSKLELPCVSMEQQRAIGELWLLSKKRQHLLREYAQQSERLMAALYSEILK